MALCLALAACTGRIVEPVPVGKGPSTVPPVTTVSGCDTSLPELKPAELRRLSKRELAHMLHDILGDTVFLAIAPTLATLPAEATDIAFDTQDNTVEFLHVDALFSLAEAVANEIVDRHPDFLQLAPCLAATGAAQRACFEQFLGRLSLVVQRRPADAAALGPYLVAYDSLAADPRTAAKVLIAAMFQSSRFYYRLELDGVARDSDETVLELTPHELAARLALDYTGSTPDAELLAAAEAGALSTPEQLEAQVRRLFESPRGRAHLDDWVTQYLHLDALPTLAYSPGFLAGASVTNLEPQLKAELVEYVAHHTFRTTGTFQDLMTSSVSFLKGPELAALYGTTPSTDASGQVELKDPRRKGLLSRAAMVVSGNDGVSPFHRGKQVITDFLCTSIGRPDPDQLPDAFAATADEGTASTRTRLTQLTQSNVCMSCHQQLNPLGFAFEELDGLGRLRTQETLHNTQTGMDATYPIDAHTSLTLDGVTHELDGATAVSRLLASSPQGASCFARKWYGFVRGKREYLLEESCSLERLAAAASDKGRGVRGMFEGLAQLPQYRVRVKPTH